MRIKQEKIENDFQKGERFIDSEGEDDDVYSTEGVEQEMEEDEISPEEAGLMEGYDNIKSLSLAITARILSLVSCSG